MNSEAISSGNVLQSDHMTPEPAEVKMFQLLSFVSKFREFQDQEGVVFSGERDRSIGGLGIALS
jgi:hypothetical protein